jgi:hypothetical protein
MIPPLKLQEKFADLVAKILETKELLGYKELKDSVLFNSLMQRAFKGDLTFNE